MRGKNEGSIYQRGARAGNGDGRWVGVVSKGHGQRETFYGTTEREVRAKVRKALSNIDDGLPASSSRTRLGDYLEDWLHAVEPTLAPSTHRDDAARVRNHIAPRGTDGRLRPGTLGAKRLAELEPSDVERLMREKQAAGLSAQSVIHIRGLLRRALKRAVRHGLVVRNVAAIADPPKLVKVREAQFLDVAEARAFMAAIAGEPLEALWVMLLASGLRRGEALALRWGDVDLAARTYSVKGSLQRVGGQLRVMPTKTKGSRSMGQLAQVAAVALAAHRARQGAAGIAPLPTAYVFTSRNGHALEPRNVNRAFAGLLKRHGLKRIRLHDLRHSIGSLMLANGESPRVVMEVLRHSQIAMTMNTYSHVMPALTRDAVDRLDALLTGGA